MEIVPLSQRDPRWKNKTLGFSTTKIGSYGCTLTALTMLINYIQKTSLTPDKVNEALKAVNAFTGNLIVWGRVPLAYPALKFVKRVYNYNNLEVSLYVYVYGYPVMVEVNAAEIGAAKHWVLYKGNRKMVDPWTGQEEATSKYKNATGYSLFQK